MTAKPVQKDVRLYVVSLKRAQERRRRIAEQLAGYGLDFVFVDAVDAVQAAPEYLREKVDEAAVIRNLGRQMGASEVACFLSHRLVYADILASRRCGGLILEDDATITPVFLDALDYFRQAGPAIAGECTIYHLEALARWYAHNVALRRRSAHRVSDRLSFAVPIDRLSTEVWGACAYYVTRKAAESLLAPDRLDTVIDHWSHWARRSSGRVLVSVPAAVIHPADHAGSEIETSRRAEQAGRPVKKKNKAFALLEGAFDDVKDALVKRVVRPIAERVL